MIDFDIFDINDSMEKELDVRGSQRGRLREKIISEEWTADYKRECKLFDELNITRLVNINHLLTDTNGQERQLNVGHWNVMGAKMRRK